jgi:hypothetical protein
MKKVKFEKKLTLNKQTVANLHNVIGGGAYIQTFDIPCTGGTNQMCPSVSPDACQSGADLNICSNMACDPVTGHPPKN